MLADVRAEPRNACREAAVRAEHLTRPVLASWTRPVAALDPIAFFAQADQHADRGLWLEPASGAARVAVGAAAELIGSGAERFRQIADAWRGLLVDAVVDPGPRGAGPLLFGGFSFDPLRGGTRDWATFPDGRLVLPERMLTVDAGGAWLTTNAIIAPPDAARVTSSAPACASEMAAPPLDQRHWEAVVRTLARGIRDGQLGIEKVVLARAANLECETPIDVAGALRNLARAYPTCTIFAVARGKACFLGASPERLVTLHGGVASTMALAGSIQRGATPAEDAALARHLLADPKERTEHGLVVQALRDGLAAGGLCERVVVDAAPRVRRLANVQHLLTEIRGRVGSGTSVLDLVERLHPTPAVGGLPSRRALELIRAYEALDRGWYAGPLGWVDQRGEGEFVVGIRAALVRGASARLFAGCGIVGGSDAAAEYAESGWKLRPMLAALGAPL